MCDLESIGDPSIFSIIRSVAAFVDSEDVRERAVHDEEIGAAQARRGADRFVKGLVRLMMDHSRLSGPEKRWTIASASVIVLTMSRRWSTGFPATRNHLLDSSSSSSS